MTPKPTKSFKIYKPTEKERIDLRLKIDRIGHMPSQRGRKRKSDQEGAILKLREQAEEIKKGGG